LLIAVGDIHYTQFKPAALVSLTVPKLCARGFAGEHYVGGRFITPQLAAAHSLEVPDYGAGVGQVARYAARDVSSGVTGDTDGVIDRSGDGDCSSSNNQREASPSAGEEVEGGDDSQVSVLMITAASEEEGRMIARTLLQDKLAACVNMVPKVTSIYEWEGQVEESTEVLLLVKSQARKVSALTARVQEMHSYEVPEVIETRVVGGSKKYLEWVVEMTGGREQ